MQFGNQKNVYFSKIFAMNKILFDYSMHLNCKNFIWIYKNIKISIYLAWELEKFFILKDI